MVVLYTCSLVVFVYKDCVDKKYGQRTFTRNEHDIKKRCNQKCIDAANKRKKRLGSGLSGDTDLVT